MKQPARTQRRRTAVDTSRPCLTAACTTHTSREALVRSLCHVVERLLLNGRVFIVIVDQQARPKQRRTLATTRLQPPTVSAPTPGRSNHSSTAIRRRH